MFEASFLLLLKYFVLNIVVPFIPGLLFLWIFYGDKFKGMILYLLSRFVGVGIVAFSLLNIQFIYFGVGKVEYLIILGLLIIILSLKLFIRKEVIKNYIDTLKIKNIFLELKTSFKKSSLTERWFTLILSVFSIYFVCISGIFNFNLPTYADDSFGNRNKPAYNIYTDGGIKLFGDESEILGRGRLGYPIFIPIYKALISQFAGGINDIYFNTWQWLVFLFGILFIFYISFSKTKNVFNSIFPIGLICSLPLVFFHSFEGYMELSSIIYCIICLRLFYKYLENNDLDYLSLGLLFGFIISYIKNDGFVIYFPGLLLGFFIVLCLKKKLGLTIKEFFKNKSNICKFVLYFVYFFIPFLLVKFVHGLGFNQAAGETSGIGLSSDIHREIFSHFSHIFFKMDNFNLILIILLLIFIFILSKKRWKENKSLFLYAGLTVFLLLIAVFLFTDNYRFVMDQTTVNRVFTTSFVLILGFSGILLSDE